MEGGTHSLEHLVPLDGGEPEAVGIGIVIAGPPAVALDEGRAPELLQAGPGGSQGLARALSTRAGVLWMETVSRVPAQDHSCPLTKPHTRPLSAPRVSVSPVPSRPWWPQHCTGRQGSASGFPLLCRWITRPTLPHESDGSSQQIQDNPDGPYEPLFTADQHVPVKYYNQLGEPREQVHCFLWKEL